MSKRSGNILFIIVVFIMLLFQWSPSAATADGSVFDLKKIDSIRDQGEKNGSLKADVNFANFPLYFIHNRGQANKEALFYAKTPGYTLWITKQGLVFDSIRTQKPEDRNSEPGKKSTPESKYAARSSRDVSRLMFIGANKDVKIEPLDMQKLKVNYFKGNDRSQWIGAIPTCAAVLYKEIYKNIDLKIYGIGKQIEYDWIVKPGGDPAAIRFAYKNVKSIKINETGDLDIATQFGSLLHKKPVAYQDKIAGTIPESLNHLKDRTRIDAAFKKVGKNVYAFVVGEYDKKNELIIDPVVLAYSTCLGGIGADYGGGIAADSNGYVYVTGYLYSTDFPTQNPYQGSVAGGWDLFVSKIDSNQSGSSSLLYSTYFGGSADEEGRGIACDNSGMVYVTGGTNSTNFPVVNQYQGDQPGRDAFIIKIDTNLSGASSLLYSTYLGGGSTDDGKGIVADNSGVVYVTGVTDSTDFPTLNQYQGDQPSSDAFITKLDTNRSGASALLFSTYLGGNGTDYGWGIAADHNGYVYVTGSTLSTDFPTQNPYRGSLASPGEEDLFVSKIDSNQSGFSSLRYSTYLGGSLSDYGYGIAADDSGVAYVTGSTTSPDFPTFGEYQGYQGNLDAFATKIDTNQSGSSSLLYSTYLGGSNSDYAYGMCVDNEGCASITGYTSSSDFPARNEFQGPQGGSDAFVTKIDANQSGDSSILYSTFLGGNSFETAAGIAVDNNRYVYVIGTTMSSNFPTLNEYQVHQSYYDAFVTKLAMEFAVNSSVSGGNGSVNPASQAVFDGQTATINLNPAPGYMVGSITDNRINAVVRNPYRIYDVKEDHDVVVTFQELVYEVTATVEGGNGSVSPESQTVSPGGTATITMIPFTGYRIGSITDNGFEMSIANPYVIHNIDRNHALKVKFISDAYPPELSLSGVRKTDGAWLIKKDYAELYISITEHPQKPIKIASFTLFKNVAGNWDALKSYSTAGDHVYIDKSLENGKKAYYKLSAYVLDGSRVTETEILEL